MVVQAYGWTYERTDEISPLNSAGHRPLSGPLPCHCKDLMLLNRQGKGTAVLMMPLGNLFRHKMGAGTNLPCVDEAPTHKTS